MDEQNIPIDIHVNKLLDWLVSRRHINKEWQKGVLEIREKINNAIQDMPAHDGIVKLLSGQHINYFHCLKIVEILKETEADSKNIFGLYGSQRMKDWQDIISCYQKDNKYLAEVSQILLRNVSYEIPNLKKQINKLGQVQLDCQKKIKEYTKTEVTCLKEFETLCKQLGIPGKNIKNELLELIKDLPEIYEKSAEKLKAVAPAIDLYEAFTEYLAGEKREVLKTLKYLVKHGNTTTYEYVKGRKPIKIDTPEAKSPSEGTDNTSSNEIDFGDDIDFGVVNESIDFEISLIDENADGSAKTDDEFEIIDHSDASSKSADIEIEVVDDNGIATGTDALTLLDNPSTRENIINNLLELQAFLKLRTFEINQESDLLWIPQMQNTPSIIQLQNLETISALMDVVSETFNEITDKRTLHLHNLKHSTNYVDILTSQLNQKLSQVNRMKTSKADMETKVSNCQKEAKELEKQTLRVITQTKEIQKQIEQDVSAKYKGRVVNLVGAISVLKLS
ncbi:CDK5 regulatory subunit-associated protein 3 [Coccinella septempunctata]|uniref:CDK5 regulatory subunit-associated protein 3 n=1 Tax=Coccinella septempunctata TaxID=41139 RepID=UPI001D07BB8B|nr:CDK5 regulatory subunit-associated protein 3 [Coccinella septempunctata]